MRDNGWKRFFSKIRSIYRQIIYSVDAELIERYRNKENLFVENRYEKRYLRFLNSLILKLATETNLFVDRIYHCITYEACVKGSGLLDYLERMNLHEMEAPGNIENIRIENRQQALKIAQDLFDLGLLHHVTVEHVFKDSGYFYTYEFPDNVFNDDVELTSK